MTRKHSHRGKAIRQERGTDRLQIRADQLGRRSARGFGVVISVARMAELRHAIAQGTLPETMRRVGRVGLSADAYAIDFNGRELVAVYDCRGQSIATFLPINAPEIRLAEQPSAIDVDEQEAV